MTEGHDLLHRLFIAAASPRPREAGLVIFDGETGEDLAGRPGYRVTVRLPHNGRDAPRESATA